MNRLNENGYQPAKICGNRDFLRILGMTDLPITLYPTGLTDVMESAHSDFERVHPNEFDTFTCKQDERRVEYNNIHASLVDSKSGFD